MVTTMAGRRARTPWAVLSVLLLQGTVRVSSTDCVPSTLSGPTGTITSPNYVNGVYPRGLDCAWTITVHIEKKVELMFDVFDVEYHDNCAYDYVLLEENGEPISVAEKDADSEIDGDPEEHPDVNFVKRTQDGKFCGTKPGNVTWGRNYTSVSNVMTVRFKSDAWVDKTGFRAHYSAIDKVPVNCTSVEKLCDDLLGCVALAKICDGSDDCQDKSDERGCECVEIPTELGICKGAIDYGNMVYPNLYGHADKTELLGSTNFTALESVRNNTCHADVFAMVCSMLAPKCVEDSTNARRGEIKPPCRTWCPEISTACSDQDLVPGDICGTLPFSADCFINRAEVTNTPPIPTGEGDGCGGLLPGNAGTFSSPGFREGLHYSVSTDCVWSLRVSPTLVPLITFNTFKLEEGPTPGDCPFDYVKVFDGEWPDGKFTSATHKLCGEVPPGFNVTTDSYILTIIFSSDKGTTREGFSASYTTTDRGSLGCSPGEKPCGDGALCVSRARRCDGEFDCWDKSDERDCECVPLEGELQELCESREESANFMTFPNLIGHDSPRSLTASTEFSGLKMLMISSCHVDIAEFVCEMMAPRCDRSTTRIMAPSRSWCEEVRSSCIDEDQWPLNFPPCDVISENPEGIEGLQGTTDNECYHGKGTNYRGDHTVTETGRTCTAWADHVYETNAFRWANLDSNYCRNPGNVAERPWCYVGDQWEFCSVPPCSGLVCSDRGQPRSVTVGPRKQSYWPGDKVTYQCDPGYSLQGSAVIKCLANATWDNDLPTCIVDERLGLRSDLFDFYSKDLSPSDERVPIVFSGQVINVVSLDEKGPEVLTDIVLELRWRDHRLTWSPATYGGLDILRVSYDDVWTPTVVLQNNADRSFTNFPTVDVTITSGGEVIWLVQTLVTTTCNLDQYLFPFDSMACPVCVKTDRKEEKMNCPLPENITAENNLNCNSSASLVTGEWSIAISAGVSSSDMGCLNLNLQRNPTYHMCTTIAPTIVLAVLMCVTFLLPIDKGDRLSYGMAILLAMVVSLVVITDFLPRSTIIPFIGTFVVVSMSLMAVFMLATVGIINVSCKQGKVPSWVRNVFLRCMARCLLMGNMAKETDKPEAVPNKVYVEEAGNDNGAFATFGEEQVLWDKFKSTGDPPPDVPAMMPGMKVMIYAIRKSLDRLNVTIEGLRPDEEEESEWMRLSYVLDRLCLFLYIIGLIAAVPLSLFLGRS
ncbi:CHRNB3 [Branchiostoma lanceolatum]|uniref:CHRNB3 protein n=1 Tax=Branchiostoma lanceolatum TaxID=7740 RepID=A0A8J9ZJB0_BRALA|nr:CHRNB3 [Branchiostoma lanceolatum]